MSPDEQQYQPSTQASPPPQAPENQGSPSHHEINPQPVPPPPEHQPTQSEQVNSPPQPKETDKSSQQSRPAESNRRQDREPQPEQDFYDQEIELEPEEEIFKWTAPNRPFKRRNKEFFTTVLLIVILVSLILFFANQFLPIAVVISLGFLTYVLASVPPETVENKITTYGVYTGTHMCFWFEMGRFWFEKKFTHDILNIETSRFPYRMMLLLTDEQKVQVEKIMKKYLIEETPPPTAFDNAAKWLTEKIPIDN